MRHGRNQAEGAAILAARHVEEFPARVKDDFVVEVDLIRPRAGACLCDRIHAVVPAWPLLEAGPIRRPAEIGRIDVGGEPLLEAVQLIGAAKMHLAAQDGLVAGAAQIMSEGRHLRREFSRIVVGTDRRYLAARQQGKPRGRAQRAIAVERFEEDALRSQGIDVRCLRDPVSIGWKGARGELIGHQNEEIGSVRQGILR